MPYWLIGGISCSQDLNLNKMSLESRAHDYKVIGWADKEAQGKNRKEGEKPVQGLSQKGMKFKKEIGTRLQVDGQQNE